MHPAMRPPILQPRWCSLDGMSSDDVQSLLAGAKAFAAVGEAGHAFRYRHVAVLCELPSSESADAVVAAASALGATVVRLRPSTLRLATGQALRDTARMLGRLYNVIECDGLGTPIVAELSRCAGVPVLGEVALAAHPVRMLADLLTMQEHAGRPPSGITLGLERSPSSPAAAAWARVAELTGLRVAVIEPAAPAATQKRCDFVHDRLYPRRAGQAPHLMAVDGATGRAEGLAPQQADCHRRVVQALLANVMS